MESDSNPLASAWGERLVTLTLKTLFLWTATSPVNDLPGKGNIDVDRFAGNHPARISNPANSQWLPTAVPKVKSDWLSRLWEYNWYFTDIPSNLFFKNLLAFSLFNGTKRKSRYLWALGYETKDFYRLGKIAWTVKVKLVVCDGYNPRNHRSRATAGRPPVARRKRGPSWPGIITPKVMLPAFDTVNSAFSGRHIGRMWVIGRYTSRLSHIGTTVRPEVCTKVYGCPLFTARYPSSSVTLTPQQDYLALQSYFVTNSSSFVAS